MTASPPPTKTMKAIERTNLGSRIASSPKKQKGDAAHKPPYHAVRRRRVAVIPKAKPEAKPPPTIDRSNNFNNTCIHDPIRQTGSTDLASIDRAID